MRKVFLSSLAIAALGAQSAFSLPVLGLQVGSGPITTIFDGGALDLGGPVVNGAVLYSNASFGGWNLTIAAGQSFSPGLVPFGLDLAVLATCTGGTCATNALTVGFADTNFKASVSAFTTTFTGTLAGSGITAKQATYWDPANSVDAGATFATFPAGSFALLSLATSGVLTASGGGPAGPAAYSLALVQRFSGVGGFSTDGNITGVPEPSSVLLSLGVLFASGTALRRKFQATA